LNVSVNNANNKYTFLNKIFSPFLLYAWGFDNLLEKAKEKINQAKQWVKSHKQHIINTVKGCVGGAIGGCVSGGAGGAVTGAIVGGVLGGPAGARAGAVEGAKLGCITGALNGCVNQGKKAWENTERDKTYNVNMLESAKEEINIENMAWGAVAGIGSGASVVKNIGSMGTKGVKVVTMGGGIIKSFNKVKKIKKDLK